MLENLNVQTVPEVGGLVHLTNLLMVYVTLYYVHWCRSLHQMIDGRLGRSLVIAEHSTF